MARTEHLLKLILKNQERMMAAIDDLAAAVAVEDTVIDSAVALINGIPALIAAAGVDPVKLGQLQADIKALAETLSASVVANTPLPTPSGSVTPPADAATQAKAAVASAAGLPDPTPAPVAAPVETPTTTT